MKPSPVLIQAATAIFYLHTPICVHSFAFLRSLPSIVIQKDRSISSIFPTPKGIHKRYHSRRFGTSPEGKDGKPASSPEEDLDLTIDVILNHLDREQSARKGEVSQRQAEEEGTLPVNTSAAKTPLLDRLTSCFPLFVFSAAVLGYKYPSTLTWVNKGQLIPFMLSLVMLCMGMTLTAEDFTRVLSFSNNHQGGQSKASKKNSSSFSAIPIGILCQYIIMPVTAYFIGKSLLLPSFPTAFLGLLLVGSCPGGTASNLVSLIARADVALSVILTSISTILASILTPLWVRFLVGSKSIQVSGWLLCKATARVVLIPVALGMVLREKLPGLADVIAPYTGFLGVVLVSLLCGGVVAQNSAMMMAAEGASSIVGPLIKILVSVLALHSVGFMAGYAAPKYLGKLSEKESRTISIETGMQNSALAVVLARACMMNSASGDITSSMISLACLPGALSATMHSCLGSALAVYWRWIDNRKKKDRSK